LCKNKDRVISQEISTWQIYASHIPKKNNILTVFKKKLKRKGREKYLEMERNMQNAKELKDK